MEAIDAIARWIPDIGALRPRLRGILCDLPLAALALAMGACSEGPGEPTRPNVILISVDTLRADHLGAYGHPRETSPFLDSLMAQGVRFENAFAQASWTLPSHVSLLTSSYPHTHQVEYDDRSIPASIPFLPELLQAAGYRTASFVSWIYLDRDYGFARGVDHFRALVPAGERTSASRDTIPADRFVNRVATWLESPPEKPFFLFLHLFDPHLSYVPPLEYARIFEPGLERVSGGEYATLRPYILGVNREKAWISAEDLRRARALYAGEIRFTDAQLERLFGILRDRGLLEDTLVVFTSDHGEEFDEHGSMEGHGWTLYDEVLHVPLGVRLPDGSLGGRTVTTQVESIDVAPTILDAVGVPIPEAFEGQSLMPLIRGESVDWDETAFSSIRRHGEKWSVRTPRFKLVYTADTGTNPWGVPASPGYELFDLVADPSERINLYAPESAPELAAKLDAFRALQRPLVEVDQPELTPEEIERLEALGYVR